MSGPRLALLALVSALVVSAPASASELRDDGGPGRWRFLAAAGETNDVRVFNPPVPHPGYIHITDAGSTITDNSGYCAAVPSVANTFECLFDALGFELGDLNDKWTGEMSWDYLGAIVDGGAGNDEHRRHVHGRRRSHGLRHREHDAEALTVRAGGWREPLARAR